MQTPYVPYQPPPKPSNPWTTLQWGIVAAILFFHALAWFGLASMIYSDKGNKSSSDPHDFAYNMGLAIGVMLIAWIVVVVPAVATVLAPRTEVALGTLAAAMPIIAGVALYPHYHARPDAANNLIGFAAIATVSFLFAVLPVWLIRRKYEAKRRQRLAWMPPPYARPTAGVWPPPPAP